MIGAMRKTIVMLILGFLMVNINGQSKIDNIKIPRRFQFGPLTWIYDELSKKYAIAIIYDTSIIKNMQAGYEFYNSSLIGVIKSIVEDSKLNYYLNEDSSVIYIVTKEKYIAREIKSKQRYIGNPERFNFPISEKLLNLVVFII
jgi:hypothetical protein